MTSINSASGVSAAFPEQDFNLETRLNAVKDTTFKLGSTLKKCLSANNPSGKSQGENDRRYQTDFSFNPAGIYLLKVIKRNTSHWRRSSVFIVNFEHISHLVLVFLLLTLNM